MNSSKLKTGILLSTVSLGFVAPLANPVLEAVKPILTVKAEGVEISKADQLKSLLSERDEVYSKYIENLIYVSIFKDFKDSIADGKGVLTSDFRNFNKLKSDAKSIVDSSKSKLDSFDSLIKDYNSKIKLAEERINNIVNVRDLAIKKLNEAKQSKSDTNVKLSESIKDIDANTKTKEASLEQKSSISGKKDSLKSELDHLNSMLSVAEKQRKDAQNDNERQQATGNIETYKRAIQKISLEISDIDKKVSEAEKSYADSEKAIANLNDKVKTYNADLEKYDKEIDDQTKALNDNQNLLKEKVEEVDKLNKSVTETTNSIFDLRIKVKDSEVLIKQADAIMKKVNEDYSKKTLTASENDSMLESTSKLMDSLLTEFNKKNDAVNHLSKNVSDYNLFVKTSVLNDYLNVPDTNALVGDTSGDSSNRTKINKYTNLEKNGDNKSIAVKNRKGDLPNRELISIEYLKSDKSDGGKVKIKLVDTKGKDLGTYNMNFDKGSKFNFKTHDLEGYKVLNGSFMDDNGKSQHVDVTKEFSTEVSGTLTYVYDEVENLDVDASKAKTKASDTLNSTVDLLSVESGDKTGQGSTSGVNGDASRSSVGIEQNGLQSTSDGMITEVSFSKDESGLIKIKGLINKDKLPEKGLSETGFDKVILNDVNGNKLGEFKVNDDYTFEGELTNVENLKDGDSVILIYGGKYYQFYYTLDGSKLYETSGGLRSADGKDGKALTDVKSKLLPHTSQESGKFGLMLGSFLTMVGLGFVAHKLYKKNKEQSE